MENHVHCTGQTLKLLLHPLVPEQGVLTLMPAQMDGYTNTCHGERDKGIDLPANVRQATLKSWALNPFALL